MKNLLLIGIISLLTLSSCANQRNINQFYNKYQGAENTTYINAPLSLAAMVLKDHKDYAKLSQKVKSIRVLTMQDLDSTRQIKIKNEIRNALQKDGFESWFSRNKNGRVLHVNTQNQGKSLKNIVISLQDNNELIIVNAKTNLTEAELTKFFNTFNKSK